MTIEMSRESRRQQLKQKSATNLETDNGNRNQDETAKQATGSPCDGGHGDEHMCLLCSEPYGKKNPKILRFNVANILNKPAMTALVQMRVMRNISVSYAKMNEYLQ